MVIDCRVFYQRQNLQHLRGLESVDRIFKSITFSLFGSYDFIHLKNGSILMRSYGERVSTDSYASFYGYILINSNGSVRHSTPKLRTTGTINSSFNNAPLFGKRNTDPTALNQYLYTQGANSDRSRLNF